MSLSQPIPLCVRGAFTPDQLIAHGQYIGLLFLVRCPTALTHQLQIGKLGTGRGCHLVPHGELCLKNHLELLFSVGAVSCNTFRRSLLARQSF